MIYQTYDHKKYSNMIYKNLQNENVHLYDSQTLIFKARLAYLLFTIFRTL